MSWLSGYQKGNELKDLRKRILEIAASYVGQTNYGGKARTGMNDPDFESKIKGVGWSSGLHWCNYFVRLVYKEALTEGNNYVSSTSSYPNTWVNKGKGKGSYLFPPVNSKGGTVINQWKNTYKNWKNSAQTSYVESTREAYQNTNNYIPITNNPTFKRGAGFNNNIGQALKAKEAIEGKYILPGDYITFDWDPGETGNTNPYRFNQHIGIYIAPATPDCSSITLIDGNWSYAVKYRNTKISSVNGFGQLITRNTV